MARRLKRRRPRVAWLPTFGGAIIPESTSSPFPGIESTLDVDTTLPNGDVAWDAFSLTFDETESAVNAQADPTKVTLRDIVQGNEWRLRRIVGKAFITALPDTVGAGAHTLADVGLGFIVCRTDDTGAPWTDFDEVNPLSQESMEDPWIWRRRWILNPSAFTPNTARSTNAYNNPEWWGFPQTTVAYGSVADGPHIDAKSNRIIHRSERLFAVLAARKMNPQAPAVAYQDFRIRMMLDYRLLGSLRSQTYGNRGNTSR